MTVNLFSWLCDRFWAHHSRDLFLPVWTIDDRSTKRMGLHIPIKTTAEVPGWILHELSAWKAGTIRCSYTNKPHMPLSIYMGFNIDILISLYISWFATRAHLYHHSCLQDCNALCILFLLDYKYILCSCKQMVVMPIAHIIIGRIPMSNTWRHFPVIQQGAHLQAWFKLNPSIEK